MEPSQVGLPSYFQCFLLYFFSLVLNTYLITVYLLYISDGLNSYIPPNSYVGTLSPNVMVLGGGVFGR